MRPTLCRCGAIPARSIPIKRTRQPGPWSKGRFHFGYLCPSIFSTCGILPFLALFPPVYHSCFFVATCDIFFALSLSGFIFIACMVSPDNLEKTWIAIQKEMYAMAGQHRIKVQIRITG